MRASCGAVGNMITLHKLFGFDLGTDVTEYERPACEWRSFGRPDKPIKPTDPAVAYLGGRGIPEGIVERYEITTKKDDDNVLVFPCYGEDGNIQFIKFRQINFDKEKGGSKEWCAKDGRSILFGMKQCNSEASDTLVITEGQIDSLSVAAAGIPNAVSVPMGKSNMKWIPHCWNWMQQFKRIVVFGDYERGAMTLLDDILMRCFDKWTVAAVNSQAYMGCKDANELLQKHGTDAIRKAVESARPIMPGEIKCLADIKYPSDDSEKLSTGIHKLDVTLNGGLPFGSLVVITGKRGDGKSTSASMINKSALEHGYTTFTYSGEMLAGDVKKWLDFQVAGPNRVIATQHGDFVSYSLSSPNIERINEWYRERAYIYDTSMISDTPIMRTIETAIRQFGARVIIVDNLMTALDFGGSDDRYAKQSDFCKQMARLAQATETIIILVAHMKKQDGTTDGNDKVSGSSDITNLASVVLSYERSKDLGENQRLIKVLKNRQTGRVNFEGITVDYDPVSRRICGPDDDLRAESNAFAVNAEGFDEVPEDLELPF
jgi:archaellum biogenesis ATPase FlaH